jgi:hypothetical protein
MGACVCWRAEVVFFDDKIDPVSERFELKVMKSTAQPWMSRVFSLFIGNLLVLTFGLGSLLGQGVQPKVSLLGVPGISTIAGSANSGYSGDGAAATLATFSNAYGLTLDSAGNIYIADSQNYVVRVVNTQNTAITVAGVAIQPGNIATVAGNGSEGNSGNGGLATSAQVGWLSAVAVDGNGNIFVADEEFGFIHKITSNGNMTIVAGSGNQYCEYGGGSNGDGGPATSATIGCPYGVAVDSIGNIYISDTYGGRIRIVNTQGIISTIAGSTASGCDNVQASGDGGPATSAVLDCPIGVHADASGNVYFADLYGNTVRVVNMQSSAITVAGVTIQPGNIDHIAGNGTGGYSGDGGPAISAQLSYPWDAVMDSVGNVYISDSENDVIRKVDTNGNITTFAGVAGSWGYSGDGGPANAASLDYPTGISADSFHNVYFSDTDSYVIRKVSGNSGGNSVDFGQVSLGSNTIQAVSLYMNQAVTISAVQANGDFIAGVSPCTSCDRRKAASSSSGPDTTHMPKSVVKLRSKMKPIQRSTPPVANDDNSNNSCVGTFAQAAVCTMFVQFTPTKPGPRWFQLTATDSNQANYTAGLTGTGVGSLVSITPGIINTPTGGASIGAVTGMARDGVGNIYATDDQFFVIWKITPQGVVSIVAGISGVAGYDGDGGPAISAHLSNPTGLGLDSVGNLYIADTMNNVIRKVDVNGIITTVAGNGTAGYSGDASLATNAQLDNPVGVLADLAGNLYIGDTYNNVVRKVSPSGKISTIAGNGTGAGTGSWQDGAQGNPNGGWAGDLGPATQAVLNGPTQMALDGNGNLYIADTWNSAIRKVDSQGNMWTVAGLCADGCQSGYSGDGGQATSAELSYPFGVGVDAAGDIYLADTNNGLIRKVDVNGVITTVAGEQAVVHANAKKLQWRSQAKSKTVHTRSAKSLGDGGLANGATIGSPVSVSVDNNGSFYLTDVSLDYVRMVDVTTSDMNFGAANPNSTSSAQTVTVSDSGNATLNLSQLSIAANFGWFGSELCNSDSPLTSGNSCLLAADFTPASGGNYTGAIILTDDAFNSPHTITLEGIGTQPDYTLGATPTTMTIVQGQSGTSTLTVSPLFGYSGTVQFACNGLPAHSACSFSPTSAVLTSDSDPITVMLTVTTTGTGTGTQASLLALPSLPGQGPDSPLNRWLLPIGLATMVLSAAGVLRRSNGRLMAMRVLGTFAILTGMVFFTACSSTSAKTSNATPLGTYSSTVTTTASATAGSGQHTAPVTITIVQ